MTAVRVNALELGIRTCTGTSMVAASETFERSRGGSERSQVAIPASVAGLALRGTTKLLRSFVRDVDAGLGPFDVAHDLFVLSGVVLAFESAEARGRVCEVFFRSRFIDGI